MNASGRFLIPLLLLFLIITLSVFLLKGLLKDHSVDSYVILGANLLFFLISIISFFIQQRGLHNKNPHVFVRTVMGAMMFKMIICIIAVIGYVYGSGHLFNKRGIFISLFLYLVYLSTEVYVVMKLNKHRKTNV